VLTLKAPVFTTDPYQQTYWHLGVLNKRVSCWQDFTHTGSVHWSNLTVGRVTWCHRPGLDSSIQSKFKCMQKTTLSFFLLETMIPQLHRHTTQTLQRNIQHQLSQNRVQSTAGTECICLAGVTSLLLQYAILGISDNQQAQPTCKYCWISAYTKIASIYYKTLSANQYWCLGVLNKRVSCWQDFTHTVSVRWSNLAVDVVTWYHHPGC
jgi:hypothetical protein